MQLDLIARPKLVAGLPAESSLRLLLEGECEAANGPLSGVPDEPSTLSLDGLASLRWAWIDDEANRLYQELLAQPVPQVSLGGVRWEFLVGLELRYDLVKALRVVAVVDELIQQKKPDRLRLFAEEDQDEDYRLLCRALADKHGVPLEVVACPRTRTAAHCGRSAPSQWWPGLKSQLHGLFNAVRRGWVSDANQRSVMLCGSPSHLGSIAERLSKEPKTRVHWLWERIAMRPYLRWRPAGVRFLDLQVPGKPANGVSARWCWEPATPAARQALRFQGISLLEVVRWWLDQQLERHGRRLAQVIPSLRSLFGQLRPAWLLLDEDATPFKRACVAVAKEYGVSTAVVQHGAPYVSFGFAPLAADWFLAWGDTSCQQLCRWGVPASRIRVTGSPRHDRWIRRAHPRSNSAPLPVQDDRVARPERSDGRGSPEDHDLRFTQGVPPVRESAGRLARVDRRKGRQAGSPTDRILLLATIHHEPHRPDIVGFQLTASTHAQMLRTVLEAVSRRPGNELIIKLHPRTPDEGFFRRLVAEFPDLAGRVRIQRRGDCVRLARRCRCVLSCASSAGIESLLAGAPVIQLMPPGSAELIDARRWGMVGTARTLPELESSLRAVLDEAAVQRASEPVRAATLASRLRVTNSDDSPTCCGCHAHARVGVPNLRQVFANVDRPAGEEIVRFLQTRSRRRIAQPASDMQSDGRRGSLQQYQEFAHSDRRS